MVKNLKVGDGGVIKVVKAMEYNSSLTPFEKLKIIVNRSYDGVKIFGDKYTKQDPGNMRFHTSHLYKLYIRYVYKFQTITNEQFLELFPYIKNERIEKWITNFEKNPNNKFKCN